ncbi:MAG: DUF3829 domain-containing protein [Kofleriaceae bacterium]
MTASALASRHLRASAFAALVAVLAIAVPTPAHAKPDAKQAKVNVYVDMLNNWSSYVYKARNQYGDVIDLAKGPTCKESNLRGPSAMGPSAKQTFATYQKDLAKKPALPVDAAAKEMAAVLVELWEPTNEASDYYGKRQWRDDDCKRGQELHARLVELWARYATADREVRAFVEKYNDDLQAAAIGKTKKKYGPKFRYHYELLLLDGKAMVRTFDAELGAAQPNVEAIKTALAGFEATLAATEALLAKDRNNAKIYNELYQGGYTQFVKHAGWFRDAIASTLKVIEEPPAKPPAKPLAPDKQKAADERAAKQRMEKLARESKQTIDAYNRMIDAANAVRISTKVK